MQVFFILLLSAYSWAIETISKETTVKEIKSMNPSKINPSHLASWYKGKVSETPNVAEAELDNHIRSIDDIRTDPVLGKILYEEMFRYKVDPSKKEPKIKINIKDGMVHDETDHVASTGFYHDDPNYLLNEATAAGLINIVKKILANENVKSTDEAMFFAMELGKTDILAVLYENGKFDANEMLLAAVGYDNTDFAILILNDHEISKEYLQHALIVSARFGNARLVQKFISHKDYDPLENEVALTFAAANNHLEVVKLLVTQGNISPAVRNLEAYEIAKKKGYTEIAEYLLFTNAQMELPSYEEYVATYKNLKPEQAKAVSEKELTSLKARASAFGKSIWKNGAKVAMFVSLVVILAILIANTEKAANHESTTPDPDPE